MSASLYKNYTTEKSFLPWLIFLLGLLSLYGGTLSFGLTYDDLLLVRHYSCEELLKNFTSPWSERFYRPLVNFVFAAEYLLFASHTGLYHLVNLLIVSAILLLFYRTMVRLFNTPVIALISGLLWMILPGNAVICSWISTRTDSVCLLFYLFAVYAFLRAIDGENINRTFYFGSLFFAACAYLSKESAVTLPLLLAAMMFFTRLRQRRARSILLAPHFVLLAGYFLLRWLVLGAKTVGERGFSQSALVAERPMVGLAGLASRFIEALVSCVYPIFLMPSMVTALLLLLALGMFFFLSQRTINKKSIFHFMLIWMFITAMPNVFDASPRLLWLPTLGSAYLLTALFIGLVENRPAHKMKLCLIAFVYLFIMLEINGMVQNCFTKTVYEATLNYDIKDRRRWPFSDLKNVRYHIREKILNYLETKD